MNRDAYREHPIRTSLARHVGASNCTDAELRAMAKQAWQERGVGVIFPDQVQNWRDRALLDRILIRLYGDKRS